MTNQRGFHQGGHGEHGDRGRGGDITTEDTESTETEKRGRELVYNIIIQ
jgi:hypothetical protein